MGWISVIVYGISLLLVIGVVLGLVWFRRGSGNSRTRLVVEIIVAIVGLAALLVLFGS